MYHDDRTERNYSRDRRHEGRYDHRYESSRYDGRNDGRYERRYERGGDNSYGGRNDSYHRYLHSSTLTLSKLASAFSPVVPTMTEDATTAATAVEVAVEVGATHQSSATIRP